MNKQVKNNNGKIPGKRTAKHRQQKINEPNNKKRKRKNNQKKNKNPEIQTALTHILFNRDSVSCEKQVLTVGVRFSPSLRGAVKPKVQVKTEKQTEEEALLQEHTDCSE